MTTSTLTPVLPAASAVNELGHLTISGCDTIDLAERFGTPAYIMDVGEMRSRAQRFVDALKATGLDGTVKFASKACPIVAVAEVFAAAGLGCDVTSGGELRIALRGGFAPESILYHGNAKSQAEINEAIEAGVGLMAIDNADEVERVANAARATGRTQKLLLRLTPGIDGDTIAAISTGQADSKFGVALEEAPDVISAISALPELELVGLHVHIGSQLGDTGALARAAEVIAPLGNFPVVNLGGGLGVAYLRDQEDGDIEAFVSGAADAAKQYFGDSVHLMLEPGRALVATAGVTLYTVESVKRNVSTWVAVDGGISDNLRPLAYGSQYEGLIANRAAAAGTVECRIAGKHCESGDEIVHHANLPDPARGDIVAVPVTGAYGHSMANNYNGALRPPVVFVEAGEAWEVVRRETYDDLLVRELGLGAR